MKLRLGPNGAHLFDRLSGANLLVDEVVVPKAFWSNAPRSVSIALTNACDLHCPFCYAPKNAANLDVYRLRAWLDELEVQGCLCVGFGGGEPTLCRHLPALCRYVTTKTDMAVTLTTHGHWFNERLASELRGNVHFIRVSMDGVGPTYESLRGRSFACFASRLATIRTVASFGINLVVNALTLLDLDRAVEFAAAAGAVELLLLPEQPVRGSGGMDCATLNAMRDWVNRYSGPIPLSISEVGAAELCIRDPVGLEMGLRAYAHIDAQGALKRSSYDPAGVVIDSEGILRALHVLSERHGMRQ